MEPPTFADSLRYHRLAAGLSQEALAERSGLSLQAVSLLERGRRHGPRRQTVQALADALNLAPAQAALLDEAARRVRRPRPSPPPRPAGLPRTEGAFLGRATDVAVLPFLLRQADTPLLTLVGPAGVGKTRLAVEVTVQAAPTFAGGATWVDLAPIRDAGLVAPTIAARLGLSGDSERIMERLIAHFRESARLLVLDNLEQVVAAADLVQELIDACPTLRVLATSRIALGLRGERLHPVAPLALPPPAVQDPLAVSHYPAVALFLDRARAVVPELALTPSTTPVMVAVCRRLDGLPLAIELAAALTRLLPPQVMLERLGGPVQGASTGVPAQAQGATLDLLGGGSWNRPDRQQTMRNAIAWSYELLSPREQSAFRTLGVFVGGWRAGPAAAVMGVPAETMAALLEALHAKHLVRIVESDERGARYGMIETIREYAAEQLAADGGAATGARDRHLDWCMAMAEDAEPHLRGQEQGSWLARLDREVDNLRAALGWARERKNDQRGLRLAAALWRFWERRGYLQEGRGWLEAALADDRGTPAARAAALEGAGVLAFQQGDYEQATTLQEQSLGLRRALKDRRGIAAALNNLGNVASRQGNYVRATAFYEESLALQRAAGNTQGIANSLATMGIVAEMQGNYGRAMTLYEESLALRRTLGDTRDIASSLDHLGIAAKKQGDYRRAVALYEEALALRRALGDRYGVAISLDNLGSVTYMQGDYGRAAAMLGESVALERELGDTQGIVDSLGSLGAVVFMQGDYGRATAMLDEGLQRARQLGDKWNVARSLGLLGVIAHMQGDCARAATLFEQSLSLSRDIGVKDLASDGLEGLAWAVSRQGQLDRAARLAGAAAAQREALGTPLAPERRAGHEQALRAMHVALGEAGFAAAWAAGRTLPPEEAVALALEAVAEMASTKAMTTPW